MKVYSTAAAAVTAEDNYNMLRPSRNSLNGGQPPKLDDAHFRLPDLGRTVSHNMTPVVSNVRSNEFDLKLKD